MTRAHTAHRLPGLTSVLHAAHPSYAAQLPEALAPLLQRLLAGGRFTHVAAALDVPHVSDITALAHDAGANATTFTRPVYAGNAISTVRAPGGVKLKFFTVRETAFAAAPLEGGAAEAEALDPIEAESNPTEHVETRLTKSDRPALGGAARVVSGGRALKSAETFQQTLYPLADALGAAVGASRAAVDAGYADNSLQVGQTGKVVAPALYVALGISGAIQHLAGMKDSKLIVAVNKVSLSVGM
jgi:electron transfer flavoprotein alpha subunit